MAEKLKKYFGEWPKFSEGQTVHFRDHRKNVQEGIIAFVQTNYGVDGPYHVYSMMVSGWKRHVHVGEKEVLCVIE